MKAEGIKKLKHKTKKQKTSTKASVKIRVEPLENWLNAEI